MYALLHPFSYCESFEQIVLTLIMVYVKIPSVTGWRGMNGAGIARLSPLVPTACVSMKQFPGLFRYQSNVSRLNVRTHYTCRYIRKYKRIICTS